MKQEFSSANTSINSTKLPAIYNKIDWKKVRNNWYETHDEMSWPFVLDYGCGRYTEHINEFLMLNSIGLIREVIGAGKRLSLRLLCAQMY